LVVANRPATQALPVVYLVTALIALTIWKVSLIQVAASRVQGQGLVIILEILYIVFGAILLLNILQESGAMHKIRQGLLGISGDRHCLQPCSLSHQSLTSFLDPRVLPSTFSKLRYKKTKKQSLG